jgi:membrane protease YdiL (CAAX protease family)
MLVSSAISAVLNLTILAGVPFLLYFAYEKLRHRRTLAESARRAGLVRGESKYLLYSAAVALAGVTVLCIFPPSLETITRQGSPQREFVGLGLSGTSIAMALLYGVVKTGFAEEFLFRGLLTGILSRRFPLWVANIVQTLIFLVPHLLVLRIMPELWPILPVIAAGALFAGWVRIRSGSILGPWLIHASGNVAMCLGVAIRTAA